MAIHKLWAKYPDLQALLRDLRTIEAQGWTDAVSSSGGAGIIVGHGAPTVTGTDGELYIDVDTGDLYTWSTP